MLDPESVCCKPGNSFQQFLLTVAGNTGNAQNFTAERLKRDIVQHAHTLGVGHAQIVYAQTQMGIDRLRTLDIQLNFFANHHFGQRRFACASSFNCADVFALTQNSHAIRDFQNLVQFVGNDDDGFSVFAHIAHDVKPIFPSPGA